MIIDCDQCEFRGTDECKDCFVMAVLARHDTPIVLEPEEEEAVTFLQEAGLAPVIKFKRRAG
jgi:hypothetical protein